MQFVERVLTTFKRNIFFVDKNDRIHTFINSLWIMNGKILR